MNRADIIGVIVSAVCLVVVLINGIVNFVTKGDVGMVSYICTTIVAMCFGSNLTILMMKKLWKIA